MAKTATMAEIRRAGCIARLRRSAGDRMSAETIDLINDIRELVHHIDRHWAEIEFDGAGGESSVDDFLCDDDHPGNTIEEFLDDLLFSDNETLRLQARYTIEKVREYMKKYGISIKDYA